MLSFDSLGRFLVDQALATSNGSFWGDRGIVNSHFGQIIVAPDDLVTLNSH